MAVHYKFKSAKDYDTIQFEGSVISVGDLKRAIIEQKKLDKAKDFDLKFSNVESKEEYINDNTMIPKNTSIIVRRVPITQRVYQPVVTSEDGTNVTSTYRYPTIPRPIDMRPPPASYICHRCGQQGHYINHCPTNGDPRFDKVKKSTGIPKTFLKLVEGQTDRVSGALMTPGGGLAVLKHNSDPFDQLSKSMQRKQSNQIPPELQCPLCKGYLKDAVITSCCAVNFCNHCILRAFYDDPNSCCPNCKKPKCAATDLTPNQKLRSLLEKRNPNPSPDSVPNGHDSIPSKTSSGSTRAEQNRERRRNDSASYRHTPYQRKTPNN